MRAVVAAFAAIWAVTAVGWAVSRYGLLGPDAGTVLARLVFFVLTPALLFDTLAPATPADVFTPALAGFVLSTLLVAATAVAVARFVRHRPAGETTVAALCASYVNAGNLGIPVAAYVLGDVALVAPVLLFQVLLAAPVALAVLDATATGRRPSLRRLALLPARNPVIPASAAGLAVAVSGWHPPAEVLRPVELLGSAAVPAALLALGMSLPGSRPFVGARADTYVAVALKVVAQPALAYVIARFGLGLTGPALLTAVVTSGLPTAQNVFVYATHYGAGQALARDAVVASTLAASVSLALVASWLV
jgi:hypothetical protein